MSMFDPDTGEASPGDTAAETPEDATDTERPESDPDEGTDGDATGDPAATDADLDFILTVDSAAALVSEAVNHPVSEAAFRRMVMRGQAPAPLPGTKTPQWSQRALDEWLYPSGTEEASGGGGDVVAAPSPGGAVHQNVFDFFEKTYSPLYELHDTDPDVMKQRSAAGQTVWCSQWWVHVDVVARLTSAWFAWEAARTSVKPAMSAWILDHGDRHFDRIMANPGPFEKCRQGHLAGMEEFNTEPAPATLRMDSDAPTPQAAPPPPPEG
jgi:hypothetical protein